MKIPKARKLPSGNWFVQLRLNGKSHSITAPTEKSAVAQAMAIKSGILKEQMEPLSITLHTAYARYIDVKRDVLSPSTVAGYERLSRNTFQGIMSLRLDKLTNDRIQREISAMARSGKSPKYIRNAEGLLSSVLRMYHPGFSMNVYMPPKEKAEPRKVSEDEIRQILAAASGSEMELPILMAVWLGMRMSEIRGARFEDIKNHKLHVCRAIVDDVHGNATAKPPKTFSGDRWLPLPSHIENLMLAQDQSTGYIVNLTGQAIYKRFTRLLEQNGIEHCRFHDLRHANAAAMILLGIESRYAQERGGWNSDWIYKQVYGYTMQNAMDKDAAAIDAYFSQMLPPSE